MKCQIVTVCNKWPEQNYYCLGEFQKSLRDHKALVLGTEPGAYKGLMSKPKFVYKAIQDRVINEPYILFVDCWDLVFQVDPSEAFLRYKKEKYKTDLIISAEKNCFPADHKEGFDKLNPTSPFKYLNSGFIIGRTEALYAALEYADVIKLPDDHWDEETQTQINPNDQELYQSLFLKQPVKISLDYNTEFSVPLHNVKLEELDLSSDLVKVNATHNYPCTIHFNGGSKTSGVREPILSHLKLI